MKTKRRETLTGTFALITFLVMVAMSTSPFAEFIVYNKLVVAGNAEETAKNLLSHRGLFTAGIFGYLFNFICDIVVAWALYLFFKPVSTKLSLLTAWFQLTYAVISIIATINLVTVLRLLTSSVYFKAFPVAQLNGQAWLMLHEFRDSWLVAYFLFALNLIGRGCLAWFSGYVPKWVAVCLFVAGIGYFTNSLQYFLFPQWPIPYIEVTYFGELIFMFWLLIVGRKLKLVVL